MPKEDVIWPQKSPWWQLTCPRGNSSGSLCLLFHKARAFIVGKDWGGPNRSCDVGHGLRSPCLCYTEVTVVC